MYIIRRAHPLVCGFRGSTNVTNTSHLNTHHPSTPSIRIHVFVSKQSQEFSQRSRAKTLKYTYIYPICAYKMDGKGGVHTRKTILNAREKWTKRYGEKQYHEDMVRVASICQWLEWEFGFNHKAQRMPYRPTVTCHSLPVATATAPHTLRITFQKCIQSILT